MGLEDVGALKRKLRCLDSIPKLRGPTQHIHMSINAHKMLGMVQINDLSLFKVL